MKKTTKIITTGALAIVLLLLGFGIGVKAQQAYEDWKGHQSVNYSLDNLDKRVKDLGPILEKLKEENTELIKDIEYLEGYTEQLTDAYNSQAELITARDEAIKELQEQVLERDATINMLNQDIEKYLYQLDQAYNDVKLIEAKILSQVEE